MNDKGTSLLETAVHFNIPTPSTIARWKKVLESQEIDDHIPEEKERLSVKKEIKKMTPVERSHEALQAENSRLKTEVAYLKKLQALIQEKEKLQTKRKRK
jgi:ethanolamine utilization cobalamin adenosyltransferase